MKKFFVCSAIILGFSLSVHAESKGTSDFGNGFDSPRSQPVSDLEKTRNAFIGIAGISIYFVKELEEKVQKNSRDFGQLGFLETAKKRQLRRDNCKIIQDFPISKALNEHMDVYKNEMTISRGSDNAKVLQISVDAGEKLDKATKTSYLAIYKANRNCENFEESLSNIVEYREAMQTYLNVLKEESGK